MQELDNPFTKDASRPFALNRPVKKGLHRKTTAEVTVPLALTTPAKKDVPRQESTEPVTEQFELTRPAEKRVPVREPKKFSFENSETALALKYRPEYLAAGGEHLVYTVPGRPDVVVKLNKQTIAETLDLAEQNHVSADSNDPTLAEDRQERLNHKRNMQTALRNSFGREHVVPQKYFLVDAPMPQGIQQSLRMFQDFSRLKSPELMPKTAKAIVAIQPHLEELQKNHLSVTAGFLESRRLAEIISDEKLKESYRELTDSLMSAQGTKKADIDLDEFTSLIDREDFTKLLQAAMEDPELKEMLRDFVEGAVDFAEQTGEILDLGKDNVIFTRDENGAWTYLIVDGLYGMQERTLDIGKVGLLKTKSGRMMTNPEQNAMLQSINFTRALNGMGKLVGAKKSYTFMPPGKATVTDVLATMLPALERSA